MKTEPFEARVNAYCAQTADRINGNQTPDLFHYTSLEVIEKILATGKLWACSADHLNDCSELRYSVAVFRAHVHRAYALEADDRALPLLKAASDVARGKLDISSVYVTSFCEVGDDAAMWRLYGDRGAGVSFAVAKSDLAKRGVLLRCQYSSDTLDDFCIDALRTLRKLFLVDLQNGLNPDPATYAHTFFDRLQWFAPAFKPHIWRDEREWRWVFLDPPTTVVTEDSGRTHVDLPIDAPLPISAVCFGPHTGPAAETKLKAAHRLAVYNDTRTYRSALTRR